MKYEKSLARTFKYKALFWLRIKQRCTFIASEVGMYSSDALGISEKKIIEVEVKVTAEDIKAEFRNKRWKHNEYLMAEMTNKRWTPNHFYLMVPTDLVEEAKKAIEKQNGNYGIIDGDKLEIVRRAKWLHKREPSSEAKFTCALRMGSELLRFHEALL